MSVKDFLILRELGLDGVGLLFGIRRAGSRREHLHLHPGLIHLLQACDDSGRVVLPHRPRRQRPGGLGQAATADAQGQLTVERALDPLVLHADTPDRSLAGITRLDADAREATITVAPLATASGRLLDKQDQPLAGKEILYAIRVWQGEPGRSPWINSFGGTATTDADVYEMYSVVTKDFEDFRYAGEPKGFKFLPRGEAFAYQNGQALTVMDDSYLLIPMTPADTRIHEEVCYLGRKLPS